MAGITSNVQVTNNLDGVMANIFAGIVKGKNVAAERLLALSSEEVPMSSADGGTLQASGQVTAADTVEEDAVVSYDTPYATRWHEDGALVDSLGRSYAGGSNFQNGRKSHYLSDPALQNVDELGRIIVTEANRG